MIKNFSDVEMFFQMTHSETLYLDNKIPIRILTQNEDIINSWKKIGLHNNDIVYSNEFYRPFNASFEKFWVIVNDSQLGSYRIGYDLCYDSDFYLTE